MTTITPDQATEEGKTLLTYSPGDQIVVTMTVKAVRDGKIIAQETDCELAEEEEVEEPEAEETVTETEAATPPTGSKLPKAVQMLTK